jgi:tetratricopeptide (TPR) repeat protein
LSNISIFISYAREDAKEARKLYDDLKNAGLNPWLDKENILPGEEWASVIKGAIEQSRFFIPLFSSYSVSKRGYIQEEFRYALDYARRFPPGDVFIIPVKLDECEIPYEDLRKIHHQELFPDWNEGFNKILKSIQRDNQANFQHQNLEEDEVHDNSSRMLAAAAKGVEQVQKKVISFAGEKSIFVGRRDYIDNKIKESLITPGSRVSIVGPGGSGKSQLAFKAIHQYYEKEGIFDIVIPIYFDLNSMMPFRQFLSKLAEKLLFSSIKINDFEKKDSIDERKEIIRNILNEKTHPLIFADNFETISYPVNAARVNNQDQPPDDAVKIKYFLNNEIPENTSVLITSEERINLGGREKTIDLEGLNGDESRELFSTLVEEQYLKNPTSDRIKQKIDSLLQKTGGHPLSIEIMAKNITGVEEIEEISNNLGDKVNVDEPNKRLQSLKASFDYTVSKLDSNLKDLLQKLTFFNSPFPLHAPEGIFLAKRKDVINLYNRSLLIRIESDDIYGKIEDPEYLLYKFHPATRNYVEIMINQGVGYNNFYNILAREYGEIFADFYCSFLDNTFTIEKEGKEKPDKIRRFNIIFERENNDFERALMLTNRSHIKAEILTLLGSILNSLGIYNKALEYHEKSNHVNKTLNNRAGIAKDYLNIGWVYSNLHDYKKALEYHTLALSEYQQLKDKLGIARENSYIGLTLSKLGSHEEALECHEKAIQIDNEINNNERFLGEDYHNMASTLYGMGNYDKALKYYEMALEKYAKIGDTLRTAYCSSGLGRTYEAMGKHDEALNHHTKAREMRNQMQDKVGIAREYYYIGLVLSSKQQSKEALESLKAAKSILEEFERQTGYRHPMLGQIQERILSAQTIKG